MKYNNIPYEIIHLILSRLSNRHLVHTSLVCRAWAILSEYYIYKDIYIHDDKQFKQWLITLKRNQNTLFNKNKKGEHVRTILFHSQVDILEQNIELLQTLCPFIESINIKTKSAPLLNIEPLYTILPAWKYTNHLTGYHKDSVITLYPYLHTQLSSAIFNYSDLLNIFSINNSNTNDYHLDLNFYSTNHCFPKLIDLQLNFSYMEMDLYILLEKLHHICPNLKKLILSCASFTINQSLSIATTTTTLNQNYNNNNTNDKKKSTFLPFYSLTSLSIYDSTINDFHCYPYLLKKYPMLDTFNMDFIYDEYYKESSLDHVNICLYLKSCQPYLFDFLIRNNENNINSSSSSSLKSISLNFIGDKQFIESIWSGKKFVQYLESYMDIKKMKHYTLESLTLNYTRQLIIKKDILGLGYILKSKALQNKLKEISLNIHNSNNIRSSGFKSLLSSNVYKSLFPNLTKLDLTSYPSFVANLTQVLNTYPHLKSLSLRHVAIFSKNHAPQRQHQIYGLQELSLSFATIMDLDKWIQLIQNKLPRLTSLNGDNITFKVNHHDQQHDMTSSSSSNRITIDLSNHGLKKLCFKTLGLYKSADIKKKITRNFIDIEWLKVNELNYSTSSWYDGSLYNLDNNKMYGSSTICCKNDYIPSYYPGNNRIRKHNHQDNYYLQVICQYAEDVLFG